MRAAIYARYSSDLQSPASIPDQVRLCRELCRREGWAIADTFTDAAISGATIRARPGVQAMMAAARAGAFEVVVTEALDRLSRDQEDTAGIYKRLAHARVAVHTAHEGPISELHVGLKGTMNALFLRDLAARIRRGQTGRALEGFTPGGLAYGYAVVKGLDERGEPIRGRRRIVPEQAAIVRRIFAEYTAGRSARAIAAALNADAIPAAKGGKWNVSSIIGNAARGNGVLHTDLYRGRLVYNRQTFSRDPDTGRRHGRMNPPEEWITAEVPELRIIEDDLWHAAQAARRARAAVPLPMRRRPRRLLSGLVRCGACGGGMTMVNPGRLGCSNHRNRGDCDAGRTLAVKALEARVLDGLRERLLAPDAVAAFVGEYRAAWRQARKAAAGAADGIRKRAAEVEARIARIVAAIEEGHAPASLAARLGELEAERDRLAATLAAAGDDAAIDLHPNAAEFYRRKVADLAGALETAPGREEAMATVRGLIDHLVIRFPPGDRTVPEVELHGQLAALIQPRPGDPEGRVGIGMFQSVAEEGLEPPTRGL